MALGQPNYGDQPTDPNAPPPLAVGPQPLPPQIAQMAAASGASANTDPTLAAPAMSSADNGATAALANSAASSADTTPTLTNQGSSNPLMRMFEKATGMVKDQPKAGEEYEGPTDNASKASALLKSLGHTLGHVGNAVASTSPALQDEATKREEFGPELAAKVGYNKGLLGLKSVANAIAQEKVNTGDQNADTRSQLANQGLQRAVGQMRVKGYVPDEATPGAFRPMTPDEIVADPILSKNRELTQAAILAKQATALASAARADALTNPQNATLALKSRDLDVREKLAQQGLGIRMHALANQDAALNEKMYMDVLNEGANSRGDQLNTDNAAPGMYRDANGNPAPFKMNQAYSPTMNQKTQQQMATTIQPMIPQIAKEVTDLQSKIGPGEGRWNDFWVNKGGLNDPDYAGLNTDLSLFATALGKVHFGARIPEGFVKDMTKMFGQAQSPENLLERIQHADGWVSGYAAQHPSTTPQRRATDTTPPPPKKDPLGIR